jgi:hypothetical protein
VVVVAEEEEVKDDEDVPEQGVQSQENVDKDGNFNACFNDVFSHFKEKYPEMQKFELQATEVENEIGEDFPDTYSRVRDGIKYTKMYNGSGINQIRIKHGCEDENEFQRFYEFLKLARKNKAKLETFVQQIKDKLRFDLYCPTDNLLKNQNKWKMETKRTLSNYFSIIFGIIVQGILLLSSLGIYTSNVNNIDIGGIIIVLLADFFSFTFFFFLTN